MNTVRSRDIGVSFVVLAAVLVGCSSVGGGSGATDRSGEEVRVVPGERVTWNDMVAVYGLGRYPEGDEFPLVEDVDWRDHLPATNEEAPPFFPFVQYQDLSFEELTATVEEPLLQALGEIEETLGVGPWEAKRTSGGRCGPKDPTIEGPHGVGRYVRLSKVTSVDPTDEQFFQMIEILDKYYPGTAKKENQFRTEDQEEYRNYHMVADVNDDLISVRIETGSGGAKVTYDSGCYITNGH